MNKPVSFLRPCAAILAMAVLPGLGHAAPLSAAPASCKTLVATGNPEYPPYLWRDPADPDRLIGANAEFMQLLAKEAGVNIDVRYIGSWARVQEEAKQGRIDLVAGAFYTLPRLDYMDYLYPPFQQTRSVIWTTQSYNLDYKKWADLKGLQGVTVINNSFGEDFDKFAKQSLKISTVASLDQAFVMLEKGRAQYLIYEDQPGWAHVGQKKITGMKALKLPVSNEELYLTVSQMSSCNVGELRGKLSKALYKLKKDDVMTKLLEKHQQTWRQQNTAP